MVVYECDRCYKKFYQKCKYDRHINRKIPCQMKNKNDKNNDVDSYYCDTCNKSFNRSDALS